MKTYTEAQVREMLGLAIALATGNANDHRGMNARLTELSGEGIGNVRHRSASKGTVLFSYDPTTREIVNRRLVGALSVDSKAALEKFAAEDGNADLSCEAWIVPWNWSTIPEPHCSDAIRRPADAAGISEIARAAADAFEREDVEFEPNAYQRAAILDYEGGDFAHLAEIRGRTAFYAAIREIGDTLLEFAIIELDDKEDVGDVDDAARRMERAAEQLTGIRSAVETSVDVPRV